MCLTFCYSQCQKLKSHFERLNNRHFEIRAWLRSDPLSKQSADNSWFTKECFSLICEDANVWYFKKKITTNLEVLCIQQLIWKFNIWKMVKHCCYGGCNSNSKRHDVKFIPFVKPTSNLQRCRRWIHLCGRDCKIVNYSKISQVS